MQRACEALLEEARGTQDTGLLRAATQRAESLGQQVQFDASEEVRRIEMESRRRHTELEGALARAKSQGIKESTRMGHNDLGEFFFQRGENHEALKAFMRTKDFCSTTAHMTEMCMNVIRVSVCLENWTQVAAYVTKARSFLSKLPQAMRASVKAQLACASGLADLSTRRFKQAARQFLSVSPSLGGEYSDVVALEDVAFYGALCALASYDRSEMRDGVASNAEFKALLELVPAMRQVVLDLTSSRYAAGLKGLDRLEVGLWFSVLPLSLVNGSARWHAAQPSLACSHILTRNLAQAYALIDPRVRSVFRDLAGEVRNASLRRYVDPYLTVQLKTMAQAFGTDVASLERELARLIMGNLISARIDSLHKVLHARHADHRKITFKKAVSAGDALVADTYSLIFRMSMATNKMVHTAPTDGGKKRAGKRPALMAAMQPRGPAAAGDDAGAEDDVEMAE